MDKHQKLSMSIGTPISETENILQLVFQIYVSDYFTEEKMTKYECQPNTKKENWYETLKHFTDLYTLRKEYSEDRAGKSGSESAASTK